MNARRLRRVLLTGAVASVMAVPVSNAATGNLVQIDGKLVYLRTLGTHPREYAVRAFGEIPSLTRSVDAMPSLLVGEWMDDDYDVPADGAVHFVDYVVNVPQRFYRLTPEPVAGADE